MSGMLLRDVGHAPRSTYGNWNGGVHGSVHQLSLQACVQAQNEAEMPSRERVQRTMLRLTETVAGLAAPFVITGLAAGSLAKS